MTADFAEMAEIADSALFDGEFYGAQVNRRSNELDGLRHFCETGWKDGLRPNAFFDTAAYVAEHQDVAASGLNPLLHYIRHGEFEGRRPVSTFDPVWYRAAYNVPGRKNALAHFLSVCETGFVLPCPEALAFALVVGLSSKATPPTSSTFFEFERDVALRSGLVDENYYLINGEDVLEEGVGAAFHYCVWGWRERRKPNIYFDTTWYLATNPEADRLSLNPLVHYILIGEAAGRRPVPWFDPLWYRSTYAPRLDGTVLSGYLASRQSQGVSPNGYFDCNWYMEIHGAEVGPRRDSFAHYLQQGAFRDLPPSPAFDPGRYRKKHLGRPSRSFRHLVRPEQENPLVHKMTHDYLDRAPE